MSILAKLEYNNIKQPLVSICVLTYNHEKFINKAIDSFLMQDVNFNVEILIHDDASTDNTQSILKQYNRDYPGLFKLLMQKENQRSKFGGGMNPRFNYPRAQGKYIALCEGDDYWTDPLKLQKQVDFLEENKEFSLCFTRANILKEGKLKIHPLPFNKTVFKGEDLLKTYNFICTTTVFFKANVFKNLPEINKYPFGDLALHLFAAKQGKIKCLEDNTAVYRIHKSGLWSRQSQQKQLKMYLEFYKIYFPHATSEEKLIIQEVAFKKILTYKTKATFLKDKVFKLKLILNYPYLGGKIIPYAKMVFKKIVSKSKKRVNA